MTKILHLRPSAEPVPTACPDRASIPELLERTAAWLRAGIDVAVATVTERHGSTPGTPGQKLALAASGAAVGTVGGGAVEHAVLQQLSRVLRGEATAELRSFALGEELGMCCGGRLVVFLERLVAVTHCHVVGAGHVARALCPLLASLGFAVTLVDDREGFDQDAPRGAAALLSGGPEELSLPEGVDAARAFCLVMTHDHGLDQRAVEWALRRGYGFVGGVGSRAKAVKTRRRLEARGFSPDAIARVRMPLGLDIGARSPEEIAVAIAAELVSIRRDRSRS